MDVIISKKYLAVLFCLWIAPVASAVWGFPIWMTISFMSMFAIYAGHEWIHAWVCKINNLHVETICLSSQGKTHILFEQAEGPNKDKIEGDVYLAGVAWDSILFTLAAISCMFYSFYMVDPLSFIVGCSLIFILIFNLAVPGSDWQEFMKRTHKRV